MVLGKTSAAPCCPACVGGAREALPSEAVAGFSRRAGWPRASFPWRSSRCGERKLPLQRWIGAAEAATGSRRRGRWHGSIVIPASLGMEGKRELPAFSS